MSPPNCAANFPRGRKIGTHRAWKRMTGLNRGDVVLVWFPNSDLVTFKRRPALVVEAENLHNGVPQAVVSMITSNPARRGHASRVFIRLNSPEAKETGLRAADGFSRDDGQSGNSAGQGDCRKAWPFEKH